VSSREEERALAHVADRASLASTSARSTICRILARHGLAEVVAQTLIDTLTEQTRVTLNFHPDRLRPDGVTVAEGLLHDGLYRSQFATGVTNGSPTAFPGGERDRWEERLFGRAYHENNTGATSHERPKYGAFNVMSHADGGSPRFGSCYFELSRGTLPRCTFTWGDSHQGPEHVGTIACFEPVLAAWLEAVEATGSALGLMNLDAPKLVSRLGTSESLRRSGTGRPPGRALDEYIEAQVHGPLVLARDVEALVIDPAFDGTQTGEHLATIASRYGITLRRHAGFVLHPSEVPSDFRGPRMPPLAERISDGAEIDAATLGQATQSLIREPTKWQDWGTAAETWQHIKQLWHVLVRFGRERKTSHP
jgi:Protein of unknown function (DUF3626)